MGKILAERHKGRWQHRGARSGFAHARRKRWPIEDRGKPGKTRKSAQWSKDVKIPPMHKISGYGIDKADERRRGALVHEVIQRGGGRKGTVSTLRTLRFLMNLNPSTRSDKVMAKDYNYLAKKYHFKRTKP